MYAETPVSEIAIRTTAVVAVLSYVARVLCDLIAQHDTLWYRRARVAWTVGCLFLLLHIALGFHFVHGWSHSRAWSHTAARTAAVTGWSWGGGLYINHTFAFLWLTDTLAWWCLGITFVYRRSWYYWSVALVFAFIMINATLVFGPRYWMLGNLCAVVSIAFLLVRRNRTKSTSQSSAAILDADDSGQRTDRRG